jgi:hypothetical protein
MNNNNIVVDCDDLKFEHPSNWLIGAPSQSGKSYFVYQILKNNKTLFKPIVNKFLYCYSEWQPLYEKMMVEIDNITFIKGIPEVENINNSVIILDDLMSQVVDDKNVLNLFTVGSHHRKNSVIFLTQNIYEKGKYARTISLNAHYFVLFKNRRDQEQILHLARQIYPGETKFFKEVFDLATCEKYGFLIVDLKQRSNNLLRLRTIDFLENLIYVFLKNK